MGIGELAYDVENPVLKVESDTNFGESGFEPESAEASFFPQQVKNVGASIFDPELAGQSFVPTKIENVGSSSFDSEAALLDAMPAGVIVEPFTTPLDAET